MIYVITFFISIFFIDRASKTNGRLSIIYYFLSVFIPATLGGLRDESIGTDVLVYVRQIWDFYQGHSSRHFIVPSHLKTFETGYLFFNYVISCFFENFHWLLFFLSFITCTLVVCGLFFYKAPIPISVGYAIYLFMFFPQSLNMVRQSLAGSIILFAYHFILKKKWISYIVIVFLATFFHKTAILAILVPAIRLYLDRKIKINYKVILLPIFVAVILLFYADVLIDTYGFLVDDKYQSYLSSGRFGKSFSLSSMAIVPIITLFFVTKMAKANTESALLTILLTLTFVLDQLSLISLFLGRISYYYKISIVYSFPLFIQWIYDSGFIRSKDVLYLFTAIFAVFYFVMVYIVAGISEVYPYSSKFLN